MKKIFILGISLYCAGLFTSCETLNKFPTNTSGGIFSLNGNWKLTSTTDNNAEMGTIVTVTPAIASAYVKTLANNNYCYRVNDDAWKSITSLPAGGFNIGYLAGACNGTTIYKDGQITVLTNSQIRINTKTIGDVNLVQEWTRVTN